MLFKLKTVSVATSICLMIIMMYWYHWNARVLSPKEVDTYMRVIEKQTMNTSARHDLSALRNFLTEDDGNPIFTVNLYKFHDTANYSQDSGFNGSGMQAYDRFSKVMIPLMLKRGSHPVFGSYWSDLYAGHWDRIVIIRYRSRRDLADLFSTNEFAQASLHKWASIKEHERMLVQATHIPNGLFIAAVLASIFGATIYLLGQIGYRCKSLFKRNNR